MEYKWKYYTTFFGMTVVLYALLYFTDFAGVADGIVIALFFMASFYTIFSTDAKVEDPETELSSPEVHYYHNSHLNRYGYYMLGGFILGAILYFLLVFIVGLRTGFVILPIWLGLVLLIKSILRNSNRELLNELVGDYVYSVMRDTITDTKKLKQIIAYITKNSDNSKAEIVTVEQIHSQFQDVPVEIIEVLRSHYSTYIGSVDLGAKITSDEVVAYEENRRENQADNSEPVQKPS